jgi:hypothetical protein
VNGKSGASRAKSKDLGRRSRPALSEPWVTGRVERLYERFATLGLPPVGQAQARDLARLVAVEETMRPLGFNELDLDHSGTGAIDPRHAPARQSLEVYEGE